MAELTDRQRRGYLPFEDLAMPGPGRVFRTERTVRLGDVDPGGLVRLDALARFAQDVASDDVRDVALDGKWGWVVRRTTVVVLRRPGFEADVGLATWCSGTGAAWAERRTTVSVGRTPVIEIVGLWVCLDPGHRRPVALEPAFLDVYGPAARSRRVSGRLTDPDPPDGARRRPWPLRHTDYDAFGHVNNAALWEAVEDEVSRRSPRAWAAAASVEYRGAIDEGAEVELASDDDGAAGLGIWVTGGGGEVLATARVRLASP